MTTPAAPAAAAAVLADLSEHIGPPDTTERLPVPLAETWVTVARWGRAGGVSLTVRVYDEGEVMVVAERLSGEGHAFPTDTSRGLRGAAEDAWAWLGWSLP
jgi:hypothetical protein